MQILQMCLTTILTDDRIVERAMSVTEAYNDFVNACTSI